jgi:hypothetical protein
MIRLLQRTWGVEDSAPASRLGFDPAADVLLDLHGGEGRKKWSFSSWRVCYNLPERAVFANLVEISHGGARRRVENRMF